MDVPRPALTRDRIVSAAIGLIERRGAEAVSMRAIAAELGVGVMSLYNHVPSKSALLDGVAERILGGVEFEAAPGEHWTDQVRGQCRAFRQIALHYPRSTLVVMTRQLRAPSGLRPVERALATLREAGFAGETAVHVFRAVIAYLTGSLLREVGVTPALAPAPRDPAALEDAVAAGFPHIAALAPVLGRCDHAAEFEFGLELLVRAIEALPRDAAQV
ncbi:TetR/AcrR family transcriptional regulator C-terminal domain-containing protein [Bailinhaonella thermotolerans]|uniref:TetR/AcrR family transcriptional regulator n=1 Tax=Bailinhaonella thermotolerans TaxID=1070861 RepID=A0A3A4B1U8_9ACTN|nr:TetR/AcrR family transcriptional regulator C-terminal domain-containing protein [Bailinhaonella thermotolerans]RJL34148.1 TetR/AcrR family transcriptional regulator [Bailinhaonella thermotolerans]